MKNRLVFWIENYFYKPNLFQSFLSFVFLPISYLYCFLMWLRYKSQTAEDFGIEIVSVGNLTVGGSGKTPLVTALAKDKEDVAIILRGYGRDSTDLHIVKDSKKILCDVSVSGDEAMIYAQKLPNAIVIVCEERKKAIIKAKEMGVRTVFLDDAYSKHAIKKRDILIEVASKNNRCLPSGPYRERHWFGKEVTFFKENVDFIRHVELKNATNKMALVTAIARPERLEMYLPEVLSKHYFADHHNYTKEELEGILQSTQADSLLVTYKDFVKIEQFDLPLSLLDLEVELLTTL